MKKITMSLLTLTLIISLIAVLVVPRVFVEPVAVYDVDDVNMIKEWLSHYTSPEPNFGSTSFIWDTSADITFGSDGGGVRVDWEDPNSTLYLFYGPAKWVICDYHTFEETVVHLKEFACYKILRMTVTAYCPCEKCCGSIAPGVTASGVPAVGFMVAAPLEYEFGTKMIIPGYNADKPVEVQDRGGMITDNKLDVLFPTHEAANQWGIKKLDVKVLK